MKQDGKGEAQIKVVSCSPTVASRYGASNAGYQVLDGEGHGTRMMG